jgi:hypothetical protein
MVIFLLRIQYYPWVILLLKALGNQPSNLRSLKLINLLSMMVSVGPQLKLNSAIDLMETLLLPYLQAWLLITNLNLRTSN